MTCKDIDELLDIGAGRASLSSAADQHLRECERCRSVFELLEGGRIETPLAREVESRIERAVLDSIEPAPALPPAGTIALRLMAMLAVVVALGIGFTGAGALHVMSLAQFLPVAVILGAGAALLAVALARETAPGQYVRSQLASPENLLFGTPLLLLAALFVLFPWKMGANFLTAGLRCAITQLVLAAPVAVVCWLLLRRGAVLSLRLIAAGAGLLAGLAGALVLHFGCVMATAPHLAVWHAGSVVVLAVMGFTLGTFALLRSRAAVK